MEEQQRRKNNKRYESGEGDDNGLKVVKKQRREGIGSVRSHVPTYSMITNNCINPLVISGAGSGCEASLEDQRRLNTLVDVNFPPEATETTNPAPKSNVQAENQGEKGDQLQVASKVEVLHDILKSPRGKVDTSTGPELGLSKSPLLSNIRRNLLMEFETDHFNCPSNFPPTPTINNQKEEDIPDNLNFPGPKDRLFNKKTEQTKLNTNFSPNQTNNINNQDLKGTKINLNPPLLTKT